MKAINATTATVRATAPILKVGVFSKSPGTRAAYSEAREGLGREPGAGQGGRRALRPDGAQSSAAPVVRIIGITLSNNRSSWETHRMWASTPCR